MGPAEKLPVIDAAHPAPTPPFKEEGNLPLTARIPA